MFVTVVMVESQVRQWFVEMRKEFLLIFPLKMYERKFFFFSNEKKATDFKTKIIIVKNEVWLF